MIEDRSPLKHSVHKVCVPNLHIAHFRKAQDDAKSYSSSDFLSGIQLAVVFSANFRTSSTVKT